MSSEDLSALSSTDPGPSSSSSVDSHSMTCPSLPQNISSQSSSSRSSLTGSSTDTAALSSILKSSSVYTLTTRSMPSSGTVSFAPLPNLAPRKRKSSVQLGVAARSHMLRNRKTIMAAEAEAMRMQSEEEGISLSPSSESAVMYVHSGTKSPKVVSPQWTYQNGEYLPTDPELAEDAVEDAFLALGRLFKGAGKSLWRKVSPSRRQSLEEISSKVEDKEPVISEKKGDKSRRRSKGFSSESEDMAMMLASEGGGRNVMSLQAILEEESKKRSSSSSSSRAHDPAPEEVADIVLTDPNAPSVHPSEHIDLPDTLPADFLNITQPSDEPSPPTSLPDLADDTDSDMSDSTAGQPDLPTTPPAELSQYPIPLAETVQ